MLKEIDVHVTCCAWRKKVILKSEDFQNLQLSSTGFSDIKRYTYEVVNFAFKHLNSISTHHHQLRLAIVLCGTRKMHALNKTYRNLDKSTNILSFSQVIKNDENSDEIVGDIYICYKSIEEEIHELNMTFLHRFTQLVVHGILHTIGYDHDNQNDADKMESTEDTIMSTLGFPKFY
ncbi:Endoribonuclease YbeY [Candidatus Fokinia solitaria]|uniref:Endoribonuclease YbeY n=1 Tax=Candidatus Fokinia solitaria TaxID=1802984 RepID=A0A2U8BRL0_9RICK|nr:rRNA maturation RNase YbeY [Candidatus Fokinia solitaria]AWD32975.1 Endoribonuclease YbeY [Candidatus Fokinia solitaria]